MSASKQRRLRDILANAGEKYEDQRLAITKMIEEGANTVSLSRYNKNIDYWKGRSAITKNKIEYGDLIIPSGTLVEIVNKRNGFEVVTPKCKCCGVQAIIKNIDRKDLLTCD